MKPVDKEVQQPFGVSVQTYIIASRIAQGHEEWLQSSEAEKDDVVAERKTLQKYLKKRHTPDEMVRDVTEEDEV